MKATFLAALVLVGLAAPALAAPPKAPDDSVRDLDLTFATGHHYYLKCASNTKDLRHCGTLTLWEEENNLKGLQSTVFNSGNIRFEPDQQLLS